MKRNTHFFKFSTQKGQALISLLIFTTIATTVTAGAVAVTIINSQSTTKFTQGETVYHVAEAGIENAILRLLRDRTYSGEILNVDSATATITVSGSGTVTITSEGKIGDNIRKIQVTGTMSNNQFSITAWNEIN
ncbi:MAG: hypothetical protein UU23_C0001G0101 [Candidatus Curtissbacteria bacterium GW2011_GWA1_40_9]|uniref:Type 4 fimbrial biogenesis protein PilX N-terminal domain-containing protein n=1 Tax=Candidatus Curtissbacteria bacterium GW2011_GWA1_40_9 TaxID=1618408 RepID=A0A0G0WSH8_9BACT|nr:MAG: hypothetical protein UU23_C0001G0101 [Candidatus Curtissbacteria bacterium GW2011_GWA1_40_9]